MAKLDVVGSWRSGSISLEGIQSDGGGPRGEAGISDDQAFSCCQSSQYVPILRDASSWPDVFVPRKMFW